jgi:uncharacterized membrane protein SpoIIM required for sporulation
MKQQLFEERYEAEWRELEAWHDRQRRKEGRGTADADLDDADFPARYRRLCQHLALARDRCYSAAVVDRLNRLALRGHHLLYGARDDRRNAVLTFIFGGFARAVRAEWRFVLAAGTLFFGPFLAMMALLQFHPDFVYYLMSASQVEDFEQMYAPSAKHLGRVREADSSFQMLGFYIWNNIKIGFQTFAGGLLFGVGSLFFLLFNGFTLGAVAGRLVHAGFATPFFSFVAGHSALELTAIMLSGAAGLKLGYALIAPGQLSRKAALIAASGSATRIMYGAAAMLLCAAFVEAFWSPLTSVPPALKYGVGIAFWTAVVVYFVVMGRGRAA